MKKIFLIPLLACFSCVMAWADNIAQITIGEAEPVGYETLSDLQTAIAALPTDGTVATITLLNDIDGGSNVTTATSILAFTADQHVVLDLKGKTISAKLNNSSARLISVTGATLTIDDSSTEKLGEIINTQTTVKNGTWGGNWHAIGCYDNAVLNLRKCHILAKSGIAVYVRNAELNVYDGVVAEATMAYGINGGGGKSDSNVFELIGGANAHIYGGQFASTGRAIAYSIDYRTVPSNTFDPVNLVISGGSFTANTNVGVITLDKYVEINIDVQGGTFNTDPSDFVAQTSYSVINNGGLYEVRPFEASATYTVYNFNELQSALESASVANPVDITLGANIIVNDAIELPHGSHLTIPAGKTLSVVTGGLYVNEGVTTNNGIISFEGAGFFSKPASVLGSGSFSGHESAIDGTNYNISNAMQLQMLAILVPQEIEEIPYKNINLLTDINLPDVYFEPIPHLGFTNVFDGHGYSINGLKVQTTGNRAALFEKLYGGIVRNVTINANVETQTGYSAILTGSIELEQGAHTEIVENVTINGSVVASCNPYGLGAFSGQVYIDFADGYVWFVNCINNASVSTTSGYNVGGFIGTNTSSKGKLGFYNCKNTAAISAHNNVGVLMGYGPGNNETIELISFSHEGSISYNSTDWTPTSNAWRYNEELYIGANKTNTIIIESIDPTVYTAVYDETEGKYVARPAGTIDNTAAYTIEWNKTSTWTDKDNGVNPEDYMVPTEADVVTVNNAAGGVVVNNGVEAEAKQVIVAADKTLTIEDGGSLVIGVGGLQIAAGATVTVEEGATLVVGANGITGDGELIVEATQDGGTGVVLVDPAATAAKARPEASVELIPDAYKISTDVYKHRYIGIPLYFEGSEVFTSANWSREPIQGGESVVSHAKTWNNGWQDVTDVNEFVPFKGYALTNESTHGVKYTFKGKLVGNGDGTMNFAYGFNLFANSYTAPINIQTLLNGLSNDVKATIYMFKNDKLQTVSKADFAGFRTPKFTVIPSLQAFFVLMDNGTSATEDINYAEAVYNNSLPNSGLYAPKRQETPDFNRVRINIAAENGASDEVYLIEAADYTNNFENGFDEVKYMNNGLNLFATTAYGRQSTEITNDLNGTFIGVQGNGTYTMTFDELVGEEYQIRDLQTNAVVAMSEANTYTFTANGTNDARFVVEAIAKTPTALGNVDEVKMFVHDNTLFISENNSDANVMVYAANGQLVLSTTAQQTISLNGLANGVYTVRVANQTLKFVK